MVGAVPGPEAAAAARVSTKPGALVPRTERGRLKSIEVSLLLAGPALGFAGPGGWGRALRIRKPRAPGKNCAGARGFAICLRLAFFPKSKASDLGAFREVKLLSLGNPVCKRLQVVSCRVGEPGVAE